MWRVQSSKGVCVWRQRSEVQDRTQPYLPPPNVPRRYKHSSDGGIICSPFPSTPDPGPKAGEGMLALYCTSLANAIGGKVGVSFHRGFSMSLLKRDRRHLAGAGWGGSVC